LKELVEPEAGGDPQSGRKWPRRSLRRLSRELEGRACPETVRRLLREMGYAPRVNVKRFTGPPHPDRDRQFEYLLAMTSEFLEAELPVISVDTKKKELIGNFRNAGTAWRRQPHQVNAHDFRQDAQGRAVPYGIYDLTHNRGHVTVGLSADTSAFAVDAIAAWWRREGAVRFPDAGEILILADAGGSNGCRPRLWKWRLQHALADRFGLDVTVCHYPQGASKWNPVEHRLFGPIRVNWAGEPLSRLEKMLALIRGTTTNTGLKVTACAHRRDYQTGVKINARQMKELALERHAICPDWNYTLYARTTENLN
jgi:hypothetical protein